MPAERVSIGLLRAYGADWVGKVTRVRRETLKEYVGRHGPTRTALRVVTESMKKAGIVRLSRFITLHPDGIDASAFAPELPYELALLPAARLRPYQQQMPDQLPERLLRAAEESGDCCQAIFDGDELVSFGWYASRASRLFNRSFTFSPDFVYMYHGFTRPEYRGMHLHALGLAEALRAFQQQGKSGILSTVNITNYRAISSCERLGFRNSGFIARIGPARLGLIITTPEVRRYGVRFSRS